MNRSPQVSLSSAMKRSFLSFAVLCLVLSAFGGNVLAVPIAVDVYQDMETGNPGDMLTTAMVNASAHPSSNWSTNSNTTFWVSTLYHRDLPGPVTVGGVTYNGTGGTRSWAYNINNQSNFVKWNMTGASNVTMGCYYTTLTTLTFQVGYDTINFWGTSFSCLQNLAPGPYLRQHSSLQPAIAYATATPSRIYINDGKTYWLNMKYDGSVGQVFFATFDPDNNYAQVGTVAACRSIYNDTPSQGDFGRNDAHGNQTNEATFSYFDQIMFDYTNAAFPLLLCGPNDSTAPTAPPVVRDGTGPDQDQTIAMSGTQLSANWDMAWDPESGIKAYQYAIGTTKGGTDVTNWTTLRCQLGITKTGLSLTNGQTYYFAVRAINGVGLTGPITNSGGQTYGPTDTTAPGAPAAVRDGWYIWGPDADETDDNHDLYANYDDASDQESGISFYQYCIGTAPGGTDTVNWTNLPGLCQEVCATNLAAPNGVTQGLRYYTSVRAINNAGITGPATISNGIIARNPNDTTPPGAPPVVRDGTGTDISTQTSTTQLSANWDNGSDAESGVRCYYYKIGTTPGGTQIANETQTGYDSPISNLTVTGLNLTVGQTYYIGVKSVNGAWASSPYTNSNGVTIVSSGNQAPSAPANVRDGTGADIAYTTSGTQLSANWDASTDSDGSVTAYQYAIGTSTGGTQTVNWTTLGNVTTVTKTGLSLTNGQTYYFSVKAVDNLGLAGNATNSNGQTVDTTAPSAPANVRDGVGADISTTGSTTQLSANWDASTDAESGISGYQYAIGTTAGGTQTVSWTSLGNVTTVTKTGLTLSVGQTYFFSVKAVNGVGLTGSATNSNGQTVVTDSTPPSAPANVRDGIGADISTTNSTTQLSANWDASTDAESGISGYQYAIGTSAGGTQTVNWTSLGNVTTVTKTGLTLSVGQTYFFSVKAVNGAGLTGSATNSNGQTVVTLSTTTYFSDNFESWSVHGGAWTSTTGETGGSSLNTSTDHAAAGTKSLKITSAASAATGVYLTKNFSPNYISGDTYVRFYAFFPTGFEAGNANTQLLRIIAGNSGSNDTGEDAAGISLCNGLWAMSLLGGNWSGTSDFASYTGVSENAWHCVEVHLSPFATTTTLECWVEGVKSSTVLTFDLSASTTVDILQFGDMSAGTASGATIYLDEIVVSNSYIGPLGSDSTPPSAPANVRDGTGTDISTTSSTTQLSANWDTATDADSGISGYQYAIGASAGGTQTVNWTLLGNVTTVTKTGLTLTVGQSYYFSVKAVNGVGLTGGATNSNGQTVVSTATTYFSDNFENWTVHGGAWSSVSGETATQTLNTSTDYARSGTKSLKLTDSDTTAVYTACLVKTFSPTISSGIYIRFYVYLPTGYNSANTGCASRRLLRLWCAGNRAQMSLSAGTRPLMEEIGGWTASQASSGLSENAWHCIEMYTATPSSSTAMQYWIDGTSWGTLTGTFTGSTVFTSMEFGDSCVGGGTNPTNTTYYVDELVVSDSYNGPLP